MIHTHKVDDSNSSHATKFKLYMAFFGSDWLDDYDSMGDYEFHMGCSSNVDFYKNYDKPIGAPIHIEDDYDSLKEYEQKLH